MARKYKFHKTYAVIWYDNRDLRWHYQDFLTKKEARIFAASFEVVMGEVVHVEIVKRLWAFNYYDGRVPLEAL